MKMNNCRECWENILDAIRNPLAEIGIESQKIKKNCHQWNLVGEFANGQLSAIKRIEDFLAEMSDQIFSGKMNHG